MKINFVKTAIGVVISLLIAYAFYSFGESENTLLLSGGSFAFLAVTMVLALGVRFEHPRTTTNLRTVSGIFFALALISNIVFAFFEFATPTYVIINGLLFLFFLLITYTVYRAKQ